jgi:hypothetical protein
MVKVPSEINLAAISASRDAIPSEEIFPTGAEQEAGLVSQVMKVSFQEPEQKATKQLRSVVGSALVRGKWGGCVGDFTW